jgi:hypothetical protein
VAILPKDRDAAGPPSPCSVFGQVFAPPATAKFTTETDAPARDYVPVGDTGLLLLGIPLNAAILMKFAPMGPFMTELYPTNVRGTGQGFCYNAGRAIGSVFMTAIGFARRLGAWHRGVDQQHQPIRVSAGAKIPH